MRALFQRIVSIKCNGFTSIAYHFFGGIFLLFPSLFSTCCRIFNKCFWEITQQNVRKKWGRKIADRINNFFFFSFKLILKFGSATTFFFRWISFLGEIYFNVHSVREREKKNTYTTNFVSILCNHTLNGRGIEMARQVGDPYVDTMKCIFDSILFDAYLLLLYIFLFSSLFFVGFV